MKRYTIFMTMSVLLCTLLTVGCSTPNTPAGSVTGTTTTNTAQTIDAMQEPTVPTLITVVTDADGTIMTNENGQIVTFIVTEATVTAVTTGNKTTSNSTITTTKKGTAITTTKPTTSPTSNEGKPTIIMPNAQQLAYISDKVVELVNAERNQLGVAPLGVPDKLVEAANIRAKECIQGANGSTNGHTRPNGDMFSTVFTEVKYGEPYNYTYRDETGKKVTTTKYSVGQSSENLANITSWNTMEQHHYGFTCTPTELDRIAQDFFSGWKGSPPHYKAMTNPIFTNIGVGVVAEESYYVDDPSIKHLNFTGIQLFTEK